MGQKSGSEMQMHTRLGSTFRRAGDPCVPHVRVMLPSDLWLFLRGQEQFQRNPDSYNGAVRENYTWSQDYTDLELKVPVPEHVVKGRQVTGLFPPLAPLSSARLSPVFSLPGPPSANPTCLLKPIRSGVGRARPAASFLCCVRSA